MRLRLSPAIVLAIVALIAALGGTAIAGGALNKKKVKKISKNVANSQITARAPGLSVASANSAGSAGSANSAGTAGTAGNVNGVLLTRFFAQDAPGVGFHTIATVGGLRIQGSCLGSPTEPALRATLNETSNNLLDVYGNPPVGVATLPAGTFSAITNGQTPFAGLGTADFVGYGSHKDYKIEWFVRRAEGGPLGDGDKCFYSGYVTVTA
jgi:hypothetical protein